MTRTVPNPSSSECVQGLRFAEGWFELGRLAEASGELDKVPPPFSDSEQALALKWRILHRQERWLECHEIALRLTSANPGCVEYWLWLARATRFSSPDGIWRARKLLLEIHQEFDDPIFLFNLACYDSQLGNLPMAQAWLTKAFVRAASFDAKTVLRLQEYVRTERDLAPLFSSDLRHKR